MKIMYCHRSRARGAEGIHISEIIRSLRKLGNEVKIVSPVKADHHYKNSRHIDFWDNFKKFVPPFFFRISELLYNLPSFLIISKHIKIFKPDFLYERYALFHFAGVEVSRRFGIPLILEVNTPYAVAWEKYDKLYFSWLAKRIEKYIFRRAQAIITVSRALKQYLVNNLGIPQGKIFVMQNGVNLQEFDWKIEAKQTSERNNLQGKIVIGFVGSLRVWHGIDLFAKAIESVCKQRSHVNFLVVGDGEMKPHLMEVIALNNLASRVSLIEFLPHRDIPECISMMDIAVMPNSNFYGSPMKIFEYMAMGKAVIAPKIASIEEVIEHGVDGYLFEQNNSEKFIEGLLLLIDDERFRKDLGNRAREKVVNNYTWDLNGERIIEILRRISTNGGKK